MSVEDVRAAESQTGEPSRERGIWSDARAEVERERRRADALDEIASGVFESSESSALWQRLIRACSIAVPFDIAILRVRAETGLELGAHQGVDERNALEFSPPVEQALLAAPSAAPFQLSEAANGNAASAALLDGVLTLYVLPLVALGELQGVMYLGFRDERELDEEGALLSALAERLAGAIAHRESIEALSRAVRSRDDVLSVVAHDLQNPITSSRSRPTCCCSVCRTLLCGARSNASCAARSAPIA